MQARSALAGLVVLAVARAGCIASPAAQTDAPRDVAPASAAAAGFPSMDMADCREGGGHSNYDLALIQDIMPEPWVLADVTEDIGAVSVQNTVPPLPTSGAQSGIYHAAFTCASFLLDGEEQGPLSGGYVGIRVEQPVFDTGPAAARHYLIVTFATDSEAVNAALDAAGLHAAASQVTVEDMGPFLHTVLDDAEHGVYEVHFQPVEAGAKWEGIARLWLQEGAGHHASMQAQAHESAIRPVALDLFDTGGQHAHAQDASALFSHTRTNDHDQDFGGVVVPIPGAGGQTAGLAYSGFARSLLPGPRPDYVLSEAWEHV